MPEQAARLQAALADRYAFERELGRGGMSAVYLATDLKNQRKVAVKVLRPELTAAVSRDRFEREISIVAHLQHPHILPLHDSGVVGNTSFFVMPYVKGETLRERIDREGQLPIEEALRLACEVADALAYAHSQSVVHRDIKPQNIMLEAGHAVVADFGIAVIADDLPGSRLTQTGFSLGSPHYMSPEQATATRRVDGRTDIYSLGCVLYEMLTGSPPFTGANVYAILARHAAEPPPSIRVVRQTVTEFLESVTFQAMAKSPADRYATAQDFMTALTEVTHERVRQTAPGRTTIPPRERAAGSDTALQRTPPAVTDRGRNRAVSIAQAGLLILTILSVYGFLSNAAFDTKLQVPTEYTPSRANFPLIGVRALIPSIFYAFVILASFLLVRTTLRLLGKGLRGVRSLNAIASRIRTESEGRWNRFWSQSSAQSIAEGYFIAAVIVASIVIVFCWPMLMGIFTSDVVILGCAHRSTQRLFQPALTALVLLVGTSGWHVFRSLGLRSEDSGRYLLAKWGTIGLLLLLLAVMILPWRLLWAADNERIALGTERGYLIKETPAELVVYNADRGSTVILPRDANGFSRLGVHGYIFEEPSVFQSGIPGCGSWNPTQN